MAKRPRLYDPRTGYPIDADTHRALVAQVRRSLERARARWREALDTLERVRRKDAVRRWRRRAAGAYQSKEDLRELLRRLLEQLERVTFEFQMKVSYEGRDAKHRGSRITTNVHLRTTRPRSAAPTDKEVFDTYVTLITALRAPKGWEYMLHDYRNDRQDKSGAWHHGKVTEVEDIEDLGWIGDIVVGGDLSAADVEVRRNIVVGEIEE